MASRTNPAALAVTPINADEAALLAGAFAADVQVKRWVEFRLTCVWADQSDSTSALAATDLDTAKTEARSARSALTSVPGFKAARLSRVTVVERALTVVSSDTSECGDGECVVTLTTRIQG